MARLRPRLTPTAKHRTMPQQRNRSYRETREARQRRKHSGNSPSMEGLFGVMIAGPLGYLAVESIMNDGLHPIHWLIAGVVGVLGYGVGHMAHLANR